MSVGLNYNDVIDQLRVAGLDVLAIETGRLVRCKSEGDRGNQKTGWYSLHELRIESGDTLIVGAYGNWRDGSDPKTGKPLSTKIDLGKQTLTSDERETIKARIAADKKRAEGERKAKAERASRRAASMWNRLSDTGESAYLSKKEVNAYGVRFSPITGNLAIPMQDTSGKIHGLQIIYNDPAIIKKKGRNKDFWPFGLTKREHYFMIGSPTWVIVVVEGYATAASIHDATGLPVVVAFDAGNIPPVAKALKKRYRKAHILIAADDDYLGRCRPCGKYTPVADELCTHCGEPHTKTNTGINMASAAALAVDGAWLIPEFEDRGTHKWTDFNDLAVQQSPYDVRSQLDACIDKLRWSPNAAAPATEQGEGGNDVDLKPISSSDELLERFTLVYGHNGTVFDGQENILLKLTDMRDACIAKWVHREWGASPEKQIVRIEQVGFDPSGNDSRIKCNLWGGWPTEPKAGSCEVLLELLEYLCNHEDNDGKLFEWVLRWCAYPIQNPGAKLKTALVLHGPQGVGKNMFFEALMAIYGQYGRVVDQDAVEDKYNDWVSRKLLLIADEVVARAELYHVKNKIKGLITGDTIRVNPKHVTSYEERNHINIIFMSNEVQPLVLEPDDRRFAVIWTPKKLSPGFYIDVKNEIDAGGIEALHDHLLNLDMGDFQPWSYPPMTRAKQDLIDLSMDSTERFINAWLDGDLDPIKPAPALSDDIYKLYRAFCSQAGIPRYAPKHILLGRAGKHPRLYKARGRHYLDGVPTNLKMSMFVFPADQRDTPDGEQQSPWLTKCIDQFGKQFDQWKEDHSD